MKNFTVIHTSISALIYSVCSFLFGGWDNLLIGLVSFVIVGFIAFLIDAIISRTLNLQMFVAVLFRKILIFSLVAIANVLDQTVIHSIAFLRTPVIIFFILSEGKAIINYAEKFGVPIPQKLLDVLNKPIEHSEDKEKKKDEEAEATQNPGP